MPAGAFFFIPAGVCQPFLPVGKRAFFTENKIGDMENRLNRFCLIAAFGIALSVYFYSAAPGAFLEDSASFSMSAATLSMGYSPGFPLWVLLAKLFTWLIPHNPARATNMMCGLFGAGTVALFYLCVEKILTKWNESFSEGADGGRIYTAPGISLTAFFLALVFAFSQTVWLQAVRAEVYTLQLFLTLSIFFLALGLEKSGHPTRLFLLAVFLWGLSATVHPLLSVSVLPGLLLMGCFKSLNVKNELFKWGWAFGLVMLAATMYLFLPIRSAQAPYFNWNHPDSWGQFLAVTTRYPDWQSSITSTASNISYPNAMRLVSFLTSEFSVVFWIFVVIGVLVLARRFSRLGLAVFVLLLSNLFVTLWATKFSARNMDLLGYLSLGTGMAVLAAGAGVCGAVFWLARRRAWLASKIAWGVPAVAGILAIFMAGKSWGKADLHRSFLAERMAKEILQTLPPRSVVVCWTDRLLCPLLYVQGALGWRPDIVILPSDFFVWPTMAAQIRQSHPDLVFEPAKAVAPRALRVREAFKAFCRKNERLVFSELEKGIMGWDRLWPAGYLVQYRKAARTAAVVPLVLDFVNKTFSGNPDFRTRGFMAREIFSWGAYLTRLGAREGELLQDRAVKLDGGNPLLWADLGKAHLFSRRFDLAETCFKLSLACDPYEGENYFHLAFVLDALGKGEEARAARTEGDWLTGNKLKPMGHNDEKTGR